MRRIIYRQNQIKESVKELISGSFSKTLCFYGAMGSGKTTLIKALVQELGGHGQAQSPTFGIVNEYHDVHGALLAYHFDFYRLQDEDEALDLGLEHYFEQDVWIFIEWPEKISSFLPHDATRIQLKVLDRQTRELTLHKNQG